MLWSKEKPPSETGTTPGEHEETQRVAAMKRVVVPKGWNVPVKQMKVDIFDKKVCAKIDWKSQETGELGKAPNSTEGASGSGLDEGERPMPAASVPVPEPPKADVDGDKWVSKVLAEARTVVKLLIKTTLNRQRFDSVSAICFVCQFFFRKFWCCRTGKKPGTYDKYDHQQLDIKQCWCHMDKKLFRSLYTQGFAVTSST